MLVREFSYPIPGANEKKVMNEEGLANDEFIGVSRIDGFTCVAISEA